MRHQPQSRSFEPRVDAVVERRLRRHQHDVGVPARQRQAAPKEAAAVSREVARLVQEREIVHGHDERRVLRRDRKRRCVDDVDRPGRALHGWPAQRVPRLVQRDAWEGQLVHVHGRGPGRRGQGVVSRGDSENLDVVALLQRLNRFQRRRRSATRYLVPQLLESNCDAQSVHRSTRMARPAS